MGQSKGRKLHSQEIRRSLLYVSSQSPVSQEMQYLVQCLQASRRVTKHCPSSQSGMRSHIARSSIGSYHLTSECWHGAPPLPLTSPPASPAKNAATGTSSPSLLSLQRLVLLASLQLQTSRARWPDEEEKAGSTSTPCGKQPTNSSASMTSVTSAK